MLTTNKAVAQSIKEKGLASISSSATIARMFGASKEDVVTAAAEGWDKGETDDD